MYSSLENARKEIIYLYLRAQELFKNVFQNLGSTANQKWHNRNDVTSSTDYSAKRTLPMAYITWNNEPRKNVLSANKFIINVYFQQNSLGATAKMLNMLL